MDIKVLRKMEYERYWIHIMHFNNVFQYLFADKKGHIFQHYIELPENKFRLFAFKLGLIKERFTQEQMEIGEKIILSGAMDAVDTIKKAEKNETHGLKQATQIVNKLKKDPRCQWIATEVTLAPATKECIHSESWLEKSEICAECKSKATVPVPEMVYKCLNHDVVVKMVDGQIPFHEVTKDSKVLSPLQMMQ